MLYNHIKSHKIEFLRQIIDLFEYKIISDSNGVEYVVYKSSSIESKDLADVEDRTAFEALENHVHLIDNIKKSDYGSIVELGKVLGEVMLNNLKCNFPNKSFVVFVTLTDSFIIRFHQKWDNEPEYFTVDDDSTDLTLRFSK